MEAASQGEAFEPADEYAITDVETLKAFSDGLRIQIVQVLAEGPLSAKELAAALDVRQTKLYYHLHLLEERGLIRVVETRMVGHLAEKVYRSVARHFRTERRKIAVTRTLSDQDVAEGIEAVLSLFLADAGEAVRAGIRAGAVNLAETTPHPQSLLLASRRLRLAPEQAAQTYGRIKALLDELTEASDDAPQNAGQYVCSVVFTPTARPEADREP